MKSSEKEIRKAGMRLLGEIRHGTWRMVEVEAYMLEQLIEPSERTDLERMREWLEDLLAEYEIADRSDVPGSIGKIRLIERILQHIADEFGVGGEDDG